MSEPTTYSTIAPSPLVPVRRIQKQSLRRRHPSTTILLLVQFIFHVGLLIGMVTAQSTTTTTTTTDICVWNNQIYNRGENMGSAFQTQCGSTIDFPCFCNPDISPFPAECPYCSFLQQGGGLLCSKDGETISFMNVDGQNEQCSCYIPFSSGEPPITSCRISGTTPSPPVSSNNNNNNNPTVAQVGTDVCTLKLDDGTVLTFQEGESYGDNVQTRCGDPMDYPCFCNLQAEDQIECPYCSFVTGSNILYCAQDDETIEFQDGSITRQCLCEIPDNFPLERPIRTCTIMDSDSGGGDTTPTPAPVVSTSVGDSCSVTNEDDGTTVLIPLGESFGNLVTGPCGSPDDWPSFCTIPIPSSVSRTTTTALRQNVLYNDPNVLYPYCIFEDTFSGAVVCARDFESVDYKDGNGNDLTCSCALDVNLLPQSTCDKQGVTPTASPPDKTDMPTPVNGTDTTPAGNGTDVEPQDSSATKKRTIAIATSSGVVFLCAVVAAFYHL